MRHSTTAVLSVAYFMVAAASLTAQRQFDVLQTRGMPLDQDATYALTHGDFDGDGDIDLVIGNSGGQNHLYLNDGRGNFVDATAGRLPAINDPTTSVAVGDVDNDGDLDLVIGNQTTLGNGTQNRLYLNDGTGVFVDKTATHMPVLDDETHALALGDVDGDGDLDLVTGNILFGAGFNLGGQTDLNRLYLNDGAGVFTDVTATHMPQITEWTESLALGDLDGDGDLDLVIGNGSRFGPRNNRIYRNDGSGRFTDVSASTLPGTNDSTTSIGIADVDGDGDLDLAFGNNGTDGLQGSLLPQQDSLFVNNGAGVFSQATATHMPIDRQPTEALMFGDVDGDGDPDIVLGTTVYGTARRERLYLNDGNGVFLDATVGRVPDVAAQTHAVAIFDVDGDGDLDLGLGVLGRNRLYRNDGTGTFLDATVPDSRLPARDSSTVALALGDVDGDGDTDVMRHVAAPSNRSELLLNDGKGRFNDATLQLPTLTDPTQDLLLFDADADGDLDAFLANGLFPPGAFQDRLLLNDGRGTFADATAQLPICTTESISAVADDVDGDGDVDLVIAKDGQNLLYQNDGTGRFVDVTATHLPTRNERTNGLALGDVDGDGDLDLVSGNVISFSGVGSQNTLYLNDGSGRFTDATATLLPLDFSETRDVAFGDVDGDGDLDLVTADALRCPTPISCYGEDRLFLNDGSGAFTEATASQLPGLPSFSSSVLLGDLDEDGDLDLVFASSGNRIHLNDGLGTFTDVSHRLASVPSSARDLAIADLDGDGDLDLFAGNTNQDQIYPNLLRQTHAPNEALVGRDYTVEVFARYGPPRLVDTVLPFLSPAPAAIPTPFGRVGLDPSQAIALPPFVIPQPAGVGSVSFAIPNDPNLVGLSVHAQALVVPFPGAPRVTNVSIDIVR